MNPNKSNKNIRNNKSKGYPKGKNRKKSNKINETNKKLKNLEFIRKEFNEFKNLTDIPIEKIVDINGYAYRIAENSDEININQIRKFFTILSLAERHENWEANFFTFKAELTISNSRNLISEDFYSIMIDLIDKVNNCNDEEEQYKNFKIFVVLFESIVAYHKKLHADQNKIEKFDNKFKGLKTVINELNEINKISINEITDDGGFADRIAKNLKNLPSNQLRKFFNNIRLMDKKSKWSEIEYDFFLLKPQLAVAVGRTIIPESFFELMSVLMDKVNKGNNQQKYNNFKIFVKFYESIIAYHNFHNHVNELNLKEEK